MTLEELITLYRAEAKDDAVPPLCSDELLALYATEGQEEACRRGELLRDSSSQMCAISIAANAETAALDPRIVRIIRARVDGQDVALVSDEVMDGIFPAWQDDTGRSRPTHLVEGMTTGALHLWPRPKDAGTIRLTVQRLPLKPLRNDNDKPEIRPELHHGIVDWMLYRAYSIQDSDLYDPTRAAQALGRFEAEFGRKTSGRNEAWVRNGQGLNPGPIA